MHSLCFSLLRKKVHKYFFLPIFLRRMSIDENFFVFSYGDHFCDVSYNVQNAMHCAHWLHGFTHTHTILHWQMMQIWARYSLLWATIIVLKVQKRNDFVVTKFFLSLFCPYLFHSEVICRTIIKQRAARAHYIRTQYTVGTTYVYSKVLYARLLCFCHVDILFFFSFYVNVEKIVKISPFSSTVDHNVYCSHEHTHDVFLTF